MHAWARRLLVPRVWVPAVVLVLFVALVGVVHRSDASQPPGPPLRQWLFDVQIRSAQDRVADGNPVTLVSARTHRDRRLCRLLPASRAVSGWLGTLHGISTEGRRGDITVALANGVMLHTASQAQLEPGTRPFESVADLRDGDLVRFSGRFVRPGDGTCIKATNLFARTGVTSPDFLFRFTSVSEASGG